ncbi:MAG: hypothetical protein F6K08_30100 [Okeania sp. SIO1H6]|nr:hypothetical protein [Okeania sp. SIO1H6]
MASSGKTFSWSRFLLVIANFTYWSDTTKMVRYMGGWGDWEINTSKYYEQKSIAQF